MTAPDRVELLRNSSTLVGIDFVRVSMDQTELSVFLHHKPSMPASLLGSLKADQVHITAQGRGEPVRVLDVFLGLENGRRFLRLPLAQRGGFCLYRIFVDHPAFDRYFNNALFSFKTG